MNTKTRIIHLLEQLVTFFKLHEEKHWAEKAELAILKLNANKESTIDILNDFVGVGMGSLIDLYICKANGHKLEKSEEETNSILNKLIEQILIIKNNLEDVEKKTIAESIAESCNKFITTQQEVQSTNSEQKMFTMKNRIKRNIKAFVKEIIPVIVGILIALWINNWNENRKDTDYMNQISLSINKELTETNEDINTNITLQKSFNDTLGFYLENNKISLLDITMKAQGVYMPTIKINSLKALSNSKIELMEYEKIAALANIEEQKEILKMKSERLVDFLYSNTKETGKDKKEFLKLLMMDIINTELALQKGIESIMTK